MYRHILFSDINTVFFWTLYNNLNKMPNDLKSLRLNFYIKNINGQYQDTVDPHSLGKL